MVTRLLGGPNVIASEKGPPLKLPQADEDSLREGAPVERIPTDLPSGIQNSRKGRLAGPPVTVVAAVEVTPCDEATMVGNSISCEGVESKSRRKHGGALPQLP